MHAQVLIDAFIRMVPSANEKTELLDKYRRDYKNNTTELANIDEFQKTYTSDKALRWYVCSLFLLFELQTTKF